MWHYWCHASTTSNWRLFFKIFNFLFIFKYFFNTAVFALWGAENAFLSRLLQGWNFSKWSLRGTNGISGTYLRDDFLSWFLETFLEDRKIDYLHGNINFFQLVPRNKNYAQIRSKEERRGNKKKFQFFFFLIYYIVFLHRKLWLIPFGFVMRKLWTILFSMQLEQFLEKIACRIHFLMQFLQLKK